MNKPQKVSGRMVYLNIGDMRGLVGQYKTFDLWLGRLRVWTTWRQK